MRIDRLTQQYKQKQREPDFSVLTDEELDYYEETLTKVGFDIDVNGKEVEGDLSLLSDAELQKIESLNQKAVEAGSYAN